MQFSIRFIALATGAIALLLLAAKSFSVLGMLIICLTLPLLAAQYARYIERWTETGIGLFLWLISVAQLSLLSGIVWFEERYGTTGRFGYLRTDWSDFFATLTIGIIFGMGLAVFNLFLDLLLTNFVRSVRQNRRSHQVSSQ